MGTTSIPSLPQPSPFTLTPSHFAGRRALKGFEFQTAYIAYVLSGFAAGKEDFVCCRVEAVEDLDALVRVQDAWVERYYQIKSMQEGTGRWTLNRLDQEGVLADFFSLFRKFRAARTAQTRVIELIVVVDGELDSDLVHLRDENIEALSSKSKLFALLCSREVVLRDPSFAPFATGIRDLCQGNAQLLMAGGASATRGPLLAEIEALATRSAMPVEVINQRLIESAAEVATSLDEFVRALRLDSRVGSLLNEAAFGRLIEAGDLSPDEARVALDLLKRSVHDESVLPAPTVIDHSILRAWLGVPRRMRLQAKPNPVEDAVTRAELLDEVSRTLRNKPFILIYGLSKIGKSQFVSALVDHNGWTSDYFWYAFTGDAGDLDRLTRHLALWVGERTGRWQLVDDIGEVGLQPSLVFERLGNATISRGCVVLDDCHKAIDSVAFELVCRLVSRYWLGCYLVLVSERKLPAAAALGADEIPLPGLTPRESILFTTKLGLDLRDSLVEFGMLSVQVGGHPVMLRATRTELPQRPTRAEVVALGQRIPEIGSAQAFLGDLSNRIFFDLLKTQDQRAWLARIAAVGFPVTQELAVRLAQVRPSLQVIGVDWRYLRSLLLDETSAGRFSVPALLKELAAASVSESERKMLQVVAARQVFQAAIASQNADFWDFQYALIALLAAERYDEAAFRFVHSFPSLMQVTSFEPLEFLFLVMNGEQLHAKILDSTVCWLMLQFEVQLRVQDSGPPSRERLYSLIRRMHALSIRSGNSAPAYGRSMLHLAIASVRIREQKESKLLTHKGRRRIFVPLDSALRAALALGVVPLLADLLHFYSDLYPLILRPNTELLKEAILRLPQSETLPISPVALIGIYTSYAASAGYSEAAMGLVQHHSDLFRSAGFNEAYFACEMAATMILHDGRSSYREARERLEPVVLHAAGLHLSPQSIAHGLFSIADSYFAEHNYVKSAEHYQRVLHEDFGASGLHQITCERLCDSLIFINKHEEAVRVAIADLRLLRGEKTPEQRARLYARLAYAYAELGSLKKAAISCLGLCRLATISGSDALDVLAATVAGWVLAHFSYSDPAIPGSSTSVIRDSKALSEDIPAEQLKKWREIDPFRARRYIHVGTLFELLRDWQRGEFLYRRAIGIVLGSDRQHTAFRETAYVYLLRLTRIHIFNGEMEAAASEFKQAYEFSTDVYLRDHPESVIGGAGAYAILHASLDQPLRNCTDEALIKFFDLVSSQFESVGSAQAWLYYRESEMLFDRLAVQSAKRRLGQAMELAAASAEHDLYWLTVQQKLFYRMQQTFGLQDDWLRDALNIVVKLATVDRLARFRTSFAESVARAVRGATTGPFGAIALVVKRLETEWHEHAFLVAAYALWFVAMRARILSGARAELESFLRSEAKFLRQSDFD